jgi:hypothetical protein
METGLLFLPQMLAAGIMMPISGWLLDRIGPKPLSIPGLLHDRAQRVRPPRCHRPARFEWAARNEGASLVPRPGRPSITQEPDWNRTRFHAIPGRSTRQPG